jgi:hypothetical protein
LHIFQFVDVAREVVEIFVDVGAPLQTQSVHHDVVEFDIVEVEVLDCEIGPNGVLGSVVRR